MTSRQRQWAIDDFKSIQAIGNGKFGKVYRAVEKNSQQPVALKVVYKSLLEKFEFFG